MEVILSVLLGIVIYFCYLEENRFKTTITPIFAIGFPYVFVLIITNVWGYIYDKKIDIRVTLYSFLYLLIFYLVGFIIRTSIVNKKANIELFIVGKRLRYSKIYFTIANIMILYMAFVYLNTFGLQVVHLNLIKKAYSGGIVSHFRNIVSMILLIKFAHKLNVEQKLEWLSCIWLFVLLVASSKYTVLMYAVALMFIYVFVSKNKINMSKLVITTIIISLIFMLVYIGRFLTDGYRLSEIPYDFILKHYLYYLNGSYYAFSEVIKENLYGSIGFGIMFGPIINIFRMICGEPLIDLSSKFISIDGLNGYSSTNVFTLFGSFQYEAGILGTILLVMILSIVTYSIYCISFKSRSTALIVLISYICSTLFFSFFNSFYGTFNLWENTAILIAIAFVEKLNVEKLKCLN